MSQKMLDMESTRLSTDRLLTHVFQEVKDIVADQMYLHESMMRTSKLYKTSYVDMTERMKSLEEKLPSVSPAMMSLMLDYTKLAATQTSLNSGNGKSNDEPLPTVKKCRKVKNKPERRTTTTSTSENSGDRKRKLNDKPAPAAKKTRKPKVKQGKTSAKQSNKKDKSNQKVADTSAEETTTPPSLTSSTETAVDGLWLDYTQLVEDISHQEKQVIDLDATGDSTVDDQYQEANLTPLQRNCNTCLYNNMLRYISCNSGQVKCHFCCMELNCMCYYDPEGMMKDMISQEFSDHILTV